MSRPASCRAAAPARRMAGERWSSGRSEMYQWSLASAPDWGKTQRSAGTPAPRAASTEQTMEPRTLVDLQVGGAELGVGERDHPVVRRHGDDLRGRAGLADPGVGICRGDLAETGPQAADASRVLGETPSVGGAQRILEEGVGVDREQHAPVHLEIAGARLVHTEHGRGGGVGRLLRPVEPAARRGTARQGAGVQGLGTGDEHHVECARADGEAGVVHEGLWRVAPDRREHELRRCVSLREAETRRHLEGRVGRMPPEGDDHPDAVGPGQQGGSGPSGCPGRDPVAILRGRPQCPGHELDRFGSLVRGKPGVGRGHDLAHADHHRGARVEGHGPRSVPGDAPRLPWPVGRLDTHARRRRLGPCRVRPEGDPAR